MSRYVVELAHIERRCHVLPGDVALGSESLGALVATIEAVTPQFVGRAAPPLELCGDHGAKAIVATRGLSVVQATHEVTGTHVDVGVALVSGSGCGLSEQARERDKPQRWVAEHNARGIAAERHGIVLQGVRLALVGARIPVPFDDGLLAAARHNVQHAREAVGSPVFGDHVDWPERAVHAVEHFSVTREAGTRIRRAGINGDAHGVLLRPGEMGDQDLSETPERRRRRSGVSVVRRSAGYWQLSHCSMSIGSTGTA
jgi:hypothetical protein